MDAFLHLSQYCKQFCRELFWCKKPDVVDNWSNCPVRICKSAQFVKDTLCNQTHQEKAELFQFMGLSDKDIKEAKELLLEEECEEYLESDEEEEEEGIEIKIKILEERKYVDINPYSHNLVGLYLDRYAELEGQDKTNQLIIDFKLDELGWSPVKEKEDEDEYSYYSFFATNDNDDFDLTWWNKHMDENYKADDMFSFYGKIEDDKDSCDKMKFTWYYEDDEKMTKYTKQNIKGIWVRFSPHYGSRKNPNTSLVFCGDGDFGA